MTTTSFWGEERETDAIYNVYLKKVKYASDGQEASTSEQPTTNGRGHDVQQHLHWETVKERVIKAGSLAKLLHCLVSDKDGELDTRHFNVFFTTYRAFASTFSVLQLLLARYSDLHDDALRRLTPRQVQINTATRRTLKSLLNYWLDMFPEDFREPPNHDSLVQLIEFSRHHDEELYEIKIKAKMLYDKVDACLDECAYEPTTSYYGRNGVTRVDVAASTSAMHANGGGGRWMTLDPMLDPMRTHPDITRSDPGFIAAQLTCREARLFRRVLLHQCQGHFWSRRNKTRRDKARVATVIATVDHFNLVSTRVISSALVLDYPRQHRADVLACWIDVAEELHHYKNFATLKAVVAGLQAQPIHRLDSIWALVAKERRELLVDLSNINSHETLDRDSGIGDDDRLVGNGYKKKDGRLRRHQKARSDMSLLDVQGMIPYLGKFLTDLTIIDDAFSDTSDGGLINFEKRRKEFEVLAKLKLYQAAASSYRIDFDTDFDRWFDLFPCLPGGDCDKLSLAIEPPRTSTPNFNKKEHSRNSSAGENNNSSGGFLPSALLNLLPMTRSESRDTNTVGSVDGETFYAVVPPVAADDRTHVNGSPLPLSVTPPRRQHAYNRSNGSVGSLNRRVRQLRATEFDGEHDGGRSFYVADESRLPICYHDSQFDPRYIWTNGDTPPLEHGLHGARALEVQENSTTLLLPPSIPPSLPSSKPPRAPSASRQQRPLPNSHSTTGLLRHSDTGTSANSVDLPGCIGAELEAPLRFPCRRDSSAICRTPTSLPDCTDTDTGASTNRSAKSGGGGGSPVPRSASTTNAHRTPTGDAADSDGALVVRVRLDDTLLTANRQPTDGEANYKSILMTNSDRVTALVNRALERHLLVGAPSDYCLVQIRANGSELLMSDTANPYYAAAKETPMNFVLRAKYANTSNNNNNNTTTSFSQSPQGGASMKKKMSLGNHTVSSSQQPQTKTRGTNKRRRSANLLKRWSSGYL